ncbi:MAG: NAD(P)-binding domain-containing protein [Planctomycetes bacterium]|nr:NAD(P)-binding domain-containing protein [Planctomycetota bacterium]
MKIGILGTGDVGQALGTGFATLGHDVKMGSRDPNQEKIRLRSIKPGPRHPPAPSRKPPPLANWRCCCTIWTGAENAIRLAGPDNLAGKVVIDTAIRSICPAAFRQNWLSAIPVPPANRFSAGYPIRGWSRLSISW